MLFIVVFSKLMYVITAGKSHLRNKWLSTETNLPWGLAQTSIIWILDIQTILILRTKLLNYTELHQQQKEHQTTSTTLKCTNYTNLHQTSPDETNLPWGLAQTSISWILDPQTILILKTNRCLCSTKQIFSTCFISTLSAFWLSLSWDALQYLIVGAKRRNEPKLLNSWNLKSFINVSC